MGVALSMIIESTLICAVTWTLWRYFRQVFVKNHLDNIPGPTCPSWVTGSCSSLIHVHDVDADCADPTGNLPQLFDRQGMPFYRDLIENYEPVVRLHGAHGVSDPRSML